MSSIPEDILWHLVADLLCEVRRVRTARKKLLEYNTIDDAVELFRNAKNIVVLTGAGVCEINT